MRAIFALGASAGGTDHGAVTLAAVSEGGQHRREITVYLHRRIAAAKISSFVMGFAVRLKYAQQLAQRPDQPCPCPTRFAQRAFTAWRFLRNQATQADFVPLALADLKPKDPCEKWALSFFATLEQAVSRWNSLAERLGSRQGGVDNGRVAATQRYGDHVGKIEIGPDDGVADEPDRKSGHISLHEAVGASFVDRVELYHPLLTPESN